MENSQQKVVLVTGGAKRIGKAIAVDMANAGYVAAIHYHNSYDGALETKETILSAGGQAECFQANLSDEVETSKLISNVVDTFGQIDLLVNNASIFEEEDWQDVTQKSWDAHMAINLRAPFVLMQEMAKICDPRQSNTSIINIIDQRVWNLSPHFISYTLAKSGLWTLTQTMAQALAPDIRVNAIGPGPTLPGERQDQSDFEAQYKNTPLQKQTSLTDICDAVRYLVTAKSVTGQMIALDGGEHLGWAQPTAGFTPIE